MEAFKNDQQYKKAQRRVKKIKRFYRNLITYVVVISFLAALNYHNNHFEYAWFLWVALGWGIAIIFKGVDAFNLNPFFNEQWEERKIKEILDKEKHEGTLKRKWE